jgi:hypothetical protein
MLFHRYTRSFAIVTATTTDELTRKRFGMGAGPDSIARGLEWEQGQTADTILKGMTIASNALRENACI